jgi:hypothetical protein
VTLVTSFDLAQLILRNGGPLGINDWPHVATQILSDPAAAIASPYGILLMGAGLLTFVIAVHDGHHLVRPSSFRRHSFTVRLQWIAFLGSTQALLGLNR